MDRSKMGMALIINNLDEEQTPTRKDVEAMGAVLKTIGRFHLTFLLKICTPQVLTFRSIVTAAAMR